MNNYYIYLHLFIFIYTLSGVFGKIASKYVFFSFKFILFYCIEIFILFVYAIAWQKIIKNIDLSTAYANRAVAIFWAMIWSYFIFKENINIKNIIGIVIIFLGIFLVNLDE